MRRNSAVIEFLLLAAVVTGTARRPLIDPLRFPQPGFSILPVGDAFYMLTTYLDMGSSTRVYLAAKVSAARIPDTQVYAPPPGERGRSLPDPFPVTIVIKCLSTTSPKLLTSIENEFEIFSELNRHKNVRKPIGLYLSPRWTCPSGIEECQYIAMTYINSDIDRLVSRGNLRLKPPVVIGAQSDNYEGIYSFEIFLLSLGLGVIDALTELHKAGFVHGDVRACNIALELPDDHHVVLLDVGASTRLTGYSEEEQEQLRNKDFAQIHRLLTKLLAGRIERIYRSPQISVLAEVFSEMAGKGKDSMVDILRRELDQQFNVSYTGEKVIYKQM